MNPTLSVALVFAALLAVEWRYRRGFVRLGIIVLAVVVWWFARLDYATAAREAGAAMEGSGALSEPRLAYTVGVDTMYRYVRHQAALYSEVRLVACMVIIWLACTPAFRSARASMPAARPEETHVAAPLV